MNLTEWLFGPPPRFPDSPQMPAWIETNGVVPKDMAHRIERAVRSALAAQASSERLATARRRAEEARKTKPRRRG